MNRIEWQDDLDTGIEVIDRQHRRMVAMANAVCEAQERGDRAAIGDVLEGLIDYTLSHFTFEEALMEDAGYAFADAHKRVHEVYAGRIEDYRPITRILLERTGLWIGLHDLRRTLAGSVFGSVKDLGTVAIALGHSTGQDVTMGYLQRQVALAALRELYVIREKTLRKVVGLDAPAPEDQALSEAQRTMVDLMRGMIKQVGLDALSPERLVQLLGP